MTQATDQRPDDRRRPEGEARRPAASWHVARTLITAASLVILASTAFVIAAAGPPGHAAAAIIFGLLLGVPIGIAATMLIIGRADTTRRSRER